MAQPDTGKRGITEDYGGNKGPFMRRIPSNKETSTFCNVIYRDEEEMPRGHLA